MMKAAWTVLTISGKCVRSDAGYDAIGAYHSFFFSSRRRHTRLQGDWSSDVCSSDLVGAQIVVESTGRFTDAKDAAKHLRGTVRKVIISAPAKNEDVTLVLGVNDGAYDPDRKSVV